MVAGLIQADLLIVLSVVDGLLTGDPTDATSRRIPLVERFDEVLLISSGLPKFARYRRDENQAGSRANSHAVGVNVIIANGKRPDILNEIMTVMTSARCFWAKETAFLPGNAGSGTRCLPRAICA